MLYKKIDLYEYFGQPRPKGGMGYLTCMCISPSHEVNFSRRHPAVLVIPGGAYWFVSERESEPLALRYVQRGYSAFILEYSCAPAAAYPVAFREAAMAMLYIRKNAEALNIDPQKVAALGCSAGGHLCGCITTMPQSEALAGLNEDAKYTVRPDAAIFCYPVITMGEKTHEGTRQNISGGNMELAASLSIERHVTSSAPPAFIWHTRNDADVPVANSLKLADAYEAAGVPFELHIYGNGVHGLSIADECVYPASEVPRHSSALPGWVDLSINWLAENGLKLED